MALNMERMKEKLNSLTGKGDSKNAFWKPVDGESNIRIVPTADGDPFKEYHFHYNVAQGGFLCPKHNFGDECSVCNFASKLWNEGTDDSKKMAKDLFAKKRFFSPVLVRGEESEGVRIWGYGKMAYESLLKIVFDPDYGDITDPENGNDLKIMYGKQPGASFPRTDIRPRPRKTTLCDESTGGDDRCAELLGSIPAFDSLFERKSSEEVSSLLDTFLDADSTDNQVEKYSAPKAMATQSSTDSVDAAFNDLLGNN
ncbi:hypothetical protein N9989_00280 [bacterium]|jgi:hypothetical protein|nr:hypothetical protein [bacterium]